MDVRPRDLLLGAVMLMLPACASTTSASTSTSSATAAPADALAVRSTDNATLRGHLEACRTGNAQRCYTAGVLLYNGLEGVRKDEERGLELDRHACSKGSRHACFFLGVNAAGTAAGSLSTEARAYFDKACELGYERACVPCPTEPIRACR